jgi:endothelin-converting enzyme/putative endopeptidase
LNKRIPLISLILALAACGQAGPPPAEKTASGAELGAWGIDLSAMDPDEAPGDDFHRYVNGHWLDTFEMPADKARYGIFDALRERSTEQVHEIVAELAGGEIAEGSLEQKVGSYYSTWMDVERLNELGAEPLKPHLDKIAAIEDRDNLMMAFANVHLVGPFGVGIIPDPADTTRYTVFAAQDGLGMPDRDFYLLDDARFREFRSAYRDYVVKLHELAGIGDAEAKAEAIIALETQLAEHHWSQAESRDIQKIYNPMTVAELQQLAPQFAWERMLDSLGLGGVEPIFVAQPSVMKAAGEMLESVPLETWKDYLAFHFIRSNAEFLSEDFDQAHFEFYSRTLNGIEEQRERWKRGADFVNANLGEAVGKLYVERHFPPDAKAQMDELVANLQAALKERLGRNEWMDEETREQALAKLATFEPRIGYTEKWTDYGPLEIEAGDMLGNSLRVNEFLWREQLDRLGGPVDRALWPYPPQTVNASYNPLLNQITFPAGILQPPFFDPHADAAVNYGAIGGVIGHEIGHGFDDQGRRFDEKGRIRDWWTPTSDERFQERSGKLVEQFNGYSPIEGMHVNGQLTLGENIGDLGGLEMAYAAYQRHVAVHGEPPVIDGYTGDQRFFMAWAQVWRSMIREDALRQRLVTDPHSPAQYRVNGAVRNIDAWYEAFDVGPQAALYLPPEERVSIW